MKPKKKHVQIAPSVEQPTVRTVSLPVRFVGLVHTVVPLVNAMCVHTGSIEKVAMMLYTTIPKCVFNAQLVFIRTHKDKLRVCLALQDPVNF